MKKKRDKFLSNINLLHRIANTISPHDTFYAITRSDSDRRGRYKQLDSFYSVLQTVLSDINDPFLNWKEEFRSAWSLKLKRPPWMIGPELDELRKEKFSVFDGR